MNRMEEYEAMLAQMEDIPASDPVGKARARLRRRRRVLRPLAGIAAVFAVFVGMINLSPTALAACREIPVLKELAEALTFNPSLRIAIEHDYVQMVGQEQSKDGVTARIEYLIVDQKQVNLFYTLDSQTYTALDATPELNYANGDRLPACISSGGVYENGELRRITIDFVDEDVPDYLELTLRLRDNGSLFREEQAALQETEAPQEERAYFTSFTFDLNFDPKYTAQGRTVELNRSVELDGQRITITDMEIYPTHIRINVEEAPENTALLKSLRFYLELEDGSRVETISNGIAATGSEKNPAVTSYRAESSYFYDADCIRLCITSADFLDKGREELYVNLRTMEHDPLPQGVRLCSAEETDSGWKLTFLTENSELTHVQVLSSTYHDLEGGEYYCGSWGSSFVHYDAATGQEMPEWGDETYYLDGFSEDEAVFQVNYSRFWIPDEPVVVELQPARDG